MTYDLIRDFSLYVGNMLDRSSNEIGFKETLEIKHLNDLELPNDNFLKIYALPISNSKFDYKKLDLNASKILSKMELIMEWDQLHYT